MARKKQVGIEEVRQEEEAERRREVREARVVLPTGTLQLFSVDWISADVKGVAEAIAKDRNWMSIPQLADAIEDAGCRDTELLFCLRCCGTSDRRIWAVLSFILHKDGYDRIMTEKGYRISPMGYLNSKTGREARTGAPFDAINSEVADQIEQQGAAIMGDEEKLYPTPPAVG